MWVLKERRVGDSVGCVDSSLVRERRGCLVEDTVSVVAIVSVVVSVSPVREKRDCRVEAIAWFEARVGGLG